FVFRMRVAKCGEGRILQDLIRRMKILALYRANELSFRLKKSLCQSDALQKALEIRLGLSDWVLALFMALAAYRAVL
ncbi:MAG: hypothetical protein O2936_15575, partial [Proteobacteria bacterium]|nr:hypothetical protein [Pseudomonadota bacterium]